jgi:AcrR family transcriptional regulator
MTRQRSDEWRKQQIRAAATRCFVRRGFAATRLLDIAKEAGLSKGGVYFHYRAKETLFQDILDTQVRSLERRWSFDPTSDQPADRTLFRLVVAHLRTLEDEPDETRLQHLLLGMAPQDASFREKLEESFRVMRVLYSGVIERGVASGVFRVDDVDRAADCVLAMVQGLAAQSTVDPDGKLPMRPHEAAEVIIRMLCGADHVAATMAAMQAETSVAAAEPSLAS